MAKGDEMGVMLSCAAKSKAAFARSRAAHWVTLAVFPALLVSSTARAQSVADDAQADALEPNGAGLLDSAPKNEEKPPTTSDEPGRFASVFAYGGFAGAPSNGKWITLAALYTLSAASLAVAGIEFVAYDRARGDAEKLLKESSDSGPCFDLSSSACRRYSDLLGDQDARATLAAAGLAASGVFLLSGVFTAQVWGNVEAAPVVSIRPQVYGLLGGAYVGVSGAF